MECCELSPFVRRVPIAHILTMGCDGAIAAVGRIVTRQSLHSLQGMQNTYDHTNIKLDTVLFLLNVIRLGILIDNASLPHAPPHSRVR